MSTLPWFRMYHRIIDDNKIKLLAFEDRWHFVALCCLTANGTLDEPDKSLRSRMVAMSLGVQLAELDEIRRRLVAVKLIGPDMKPLAWSELQFKSDHDATAARRQREKRKRDKELKDSNGRVTRDSRKRHAARADTDKDISAKADCASGDALKPEHFMQSWNRIADTLGKPAIRKLSPERRQLVNARIAQNTLDDVREVFAAIPASPFLRGDTGWKGCTFDWIIKKGNFQKILEGNYRD